MKARLQDRFIKLFVMPLLCGIFLSIFVTVGILCMFSYGYFTNKFIVNLLQEAEYKKTLPIISNAENLLFKKFQNSINTLLSMKKYYLSIVSGDINVDLDDYSKMKNFVEKYSFNGIKFGENYYEYLRNIQKNSNASHLDYNEWHINDKITSLNDLNENIKNIYALSQLYMFTNMNMIMKAYYQINEQILYAAFTSTDLVISYPIDLSGSENYEFYQNMTNPSWCRNEESKVPDYFYFYCRPWFIESEELFHKHKMKVMISTPYASVEKQQTTMTLCVRFEDPIKLNLEKEKENYILFCSDILIDDLTSILDHYNNLLTGYFFIMRITSEVPVYYPNSLDKKLSKNLIYHEFTHNSEYYINELMVYEKLLNNFNTKVNYTENLKIEQKEFLMNGQNFTFQIFPVFLNLDDTTPNKTDHILSIVYISNIKPYSSIIELSQSFLIPRIILQVIIFIIMGCILFLISRYLIKSIAVNIVKPIKSMKATLLGMNKKNLLPDSALEGFKMESKFIDSDDHSNSSSEESVEEEDFLVDIRSVDIEELFNTLINLKEVFNFTQKNLTINDHDNNILNHLFAKYTFKEVKNFKGKYLCDSNVGNFALKCKKYDKAIFHLGESINDVYNPVGYVISNCKSDNSLTMSGISTKSKVIKKACSKVSNQKDKMRLDNAKKKYLESRYPKIIYAFKKYYNNLNKLIKADNPDLKLELDSFCSKSYHSLSKYEKYLEEYLKLANIMNDNKKKAEAILEINEFYINFKLKPLKRKVYDRLCSFPCQDSNKIKEETIGIINQNFLLFDKIVSTILSNVPVNEYLKKILEMIEVSKKESSELIEIPIYVLIQKANYLKGKFCYYSQNYKMAFYFFNESRMNNFISNAIITRDSYKKLKKIVQIFENIVKIKSTVINCEVDEGRNKVKRLLKLESKQIKQSQERISEYMSYVNNELGKYVTNPKDIAILLNFSYLLKKNDEQEMNRNYKKIELLIGVANMIFKKYTTYEDRFTLFAYTSHANALINLSYKNASTYDFLSDQFKNISRKEFYSDLMESCEPCLLKSAETVDNYLTKKNESGKREKWIIAITEGVGKNDLEYLQRNDIHESIFKNSENVNFILVEFGRENILKEFTHKFNFNKSGILHISRLDRLRSKMKIVGNIKDEVVFIQERYDK